MCGLALDVCVNARFPWFVFTFKDAEVWRDGRGATSCGRPLDNGVAQVTPSTLSLVLVRLRTCSSALRVKGLDGELGGCEIEVCLFLSISL